MSKKLLTSIRTVGGRAPNLARTYVSGSIFTTEKCPEPTCPCTETPAGLDIDRESPLFGTVPLYQRHIVVLTKSNDWPSRIQDSEVPLIKNLKKAVAPGGEAHDHRVQVMVSAATFRDQQFFKDQNPAHASVLLYGYHPMYGNIGMPRFHGTSEDVLDAITEVSHPSTPSKTGDFDFMNNRNLGRDEHNAAEIYICGHGSRDNRCGIMGPLLVHEFEKALHRRSERGSSWSKESTKKVSFGDEHPPKVGMISHVGGHKFAGNVIINFPAKHLGWRGLSGYAIWYGRVEPRHVEGIVQETLLNRRIIQELFRGGVNKFGSPLTMALIEQEGRKVQSLLEDGME